MADLTPLAVYVHWPYCSRICPYCDFNVYKGAQNAELVSAIITDLKHWRDWSGPRTINSIHFGGGTPSLMQVGDIASIIKTVDDLWGVPNGIEIGLEANPSDAKDDSWTGYAAAGVNRLSLGVQSFDDEALSFLGRNHNRRDAKTAVETALALFPNVSLDLIYGLAGHDTSADANLAVALGPQHVSTYQLTIEAGTAFHKAEQRGDRRAVDRDPSADTFDVLSETLTQAGYGRYEISNWTRPGFESQHNFAYWRGYDYVGVGPGAHGRITTDQGRVATTAFMKPAEYITAVSSSGIESRELLSPAERASEYLMMGLRTREGISVKDYEGWAERPLPASVLSDLIDTEFLKLESDRLIATHSGRDVLDYITGKLLT